MIVNQNKKAIHWVGKLEVNSKRNNDRYKTIFPLNYTTKSIKVEIKGGQ